jgi:hypothetical protein
MWETMISEVLDDSRQLVGRYITISLFERLTVTGQYLKEFL